MAILQVTGTVTDSDGVVTSYSGTLTTQSAPVIDSVVITPQSAPIGTLRTITITAHDVDGGTLAYTCNVGGVAATATAQPNVFTFTA
jgi:hypothetical protein